MSILKEIISFEADSPIWGIKYNAPRIAIEVRNQNEQEVKYVILDESLTVLQKITPAENWLVNLEYLTNTELILSTFEESEKPEKKDVLIYDLASGKEEVISNASVLEINENKISILDHKTQEIQKKNIQNEQVKPIYLPAHYPQESEHIKTVADFLRKSVSKNKVVSVDYLETKQHIIISYFCLENEILNSYLLITDLNGAPIHQFTTGEKLNGIAFDTFFLVENRLYYIAYNNILSCISL